MYKVIGINKDKELKALRKKTKRFVPPCHYRDSYKIHSYKEEPSKDYSFFDTVEDIKSCSNSKKEGCKIKSCLLNKEIEVNKKVLLTSLIGATVGIIGVGCAIKKMNSKSSKNLLSMAPSLMKITKNLF